jgi:hypothetical protein
MAAQPPPRAGLPLVAPNASFIRKQPWIILPKSDQRYQTQPCTKYVFEYYRSVSHPAEIYGQIPANDRLGA